MKMFERYGTVAVAGDWHGVKHWMVKFVVWADRLGIETIVHVGDIGFFEMRDLTFLEHELAARDIMLLFIDGNHENHELIVSLPRDEFGMGYVTDHIRHIPRGHLFSLNGQTWMGFGGASSIDRRERIEGVDWWPGELITYSQVMSVTGKRADVLVTHDVPMGVPTIDNRYIKHNNPHWPAERIAESDEQRKLLRAVFDEVQPQYVFHGHHHYAYMDTLEGATVVGLAMEQRPWHYQTAVLHMHGVMDFLEADHPFLPIS